MISYNVVVGDTLSKVLVRFVPSLGSSMGSARFFIVFLVTLVCCAHVYGLYDNVRCNKFSIKMPFSVCHDAALLVQKRFTSRKNQFYKVRAISVQKTAGTMFVITISAQKDWFFMLSSLILLCSLVSVILILLTVIYKLFNGDYANV